MTEVCINCRGYKNGWCSIKKHYVGRPADCSCPEWEQKDILNCPFCGNEVSIGKTYPESRYYFFAHTLGTNCPVLGKLIRIEADTEEEAIRKWNTRF